MVQRQNPGRFAALGGVLYAHLDALAGFELEQAAAAQYAFVDEYVLAGVVGGDEAKALVGLEPLHGARHLDFRTGGGGGTVTAVAVPVAAAAAVAVTTAAIAATVA